jgi:hypothetical protein
VRMSITSTDGWAVRIVCSSSGVMVFMADNLSLQLRFSERKASTSASTSSRVL